MGVERFLNSEQQEALNNLVVDLNKYCEMESFLNIHTHTNALTISNSISPDIIEFDKNTLSISQDHFIIQLNIDKAINSGTFSIEYFGEDDSYYVRCEDLELYFDFI